MLTAYIRNGATATPQHTYADIQPTFISRTDMAIDALRPPPIPKVYEPPRHKLIPSAIHEPQARIVLAMKPPPFSINSGKDPGPRFPVNAQQGYGRHQKKGLAYMASGVDKTGGPLLKQAHTFYAGLNNPIPLPA